MKKERVRWRAWGALAGVLSVLAGASIAILVQAAGAASDCCGSGSDSGFGDGVYIGLGLVVLLCALIQLMTLAGTPLIGAAGAGLAALPQIVLVVVEGLDPNTDRGGVLIWSLPLPFLAVAAWRALVARRRDGAPGRSPLALS
jgi:hypothetical protein